MESYESKQQQILLPAEVIFAAVSRFDALTPALQDKVEEWQASEDTCSFKVKSFTVRLKMVDKVAPKHVKITGDDGGVPIDFAFWIQLHSVSDRDTRIRLVLHAELNMMMRMMVGGKIKTALDQVVEGLANAFNNMPLH